MRLRTTKSRKRGTNGFSSFEVQIATMSKLDLSNIQEVYVCGFIPSYLLPKKIPWSLDPFLHLLVTDIEDAIIDGRLLLSCVIVETTKINNNYNIKLLVYNYM